MWSSFGPQQLHPSPRLGPGEEEETNDRKVATLNKVLGATAAAVKLKSSKEIRKRLHKVDGNENFLLRK